jgi:ADP-heptose:LPS heptosyltransferase
LVAIHPSASDRSKRWMPERFASVADQLIDTRRATIVLVAGASDAIDAQAVERQMRHRPLNLAGRLSVGELAALLRRCRALISNDSAPVHVAAAVGTPVIAIFGRTQPGLGARRWGPLGEQHLVLQTDGPCERARPHDCDVERCRLLALGVAEVYQAATSLLDRVPKGA